MRPGRALTGLASIVAWALLLLVCGHIQVASAVEHCSDEGPSLAGLLAGRHHDVTEEAHDTSFLLQASRSAAGLLARAGHGAAPAWAGQHGPAAAPSGLPLSGHAGAGVGVAVGTSINQLANASGTAPALIGARDAAKHRPSITENLDNIGPQLALGGILCSLPIFCCLYCAGAMPSVFYPYRGGGFRSSAEATAWLPCGPEQQVAFDPPATGPPKRPLAMAQQPLAAPQQPLAVPQQPPAMPQQGQAQPEAQHGGAVSIVQGSQYVVGAAAPVVSRPLGVLGFGTNIEAVGEGNAEGPGSYMIVHDATAVTNGSACTPPIIAELPAGTLVSVLEVLQCPESHRLRARIEAPAGWISLKDTVDGYRWARKHEAQALSIAMAPPPSLVCTSVPGGVAGPGVAAGPVLTPTSSLVEANIGPPVPTPGHVVHISVRELFEGDRIGLSLTDDLSILAFANHSAAQFGWAVGDRVLRLNGTPVASKPEFLDELQKAINFLKTTGQSLAFEVLRPSAAAGSPAL